MRSIVSGVLSSLLACILLVGLVFAQGVSDTDVNRVANRLYCPVCENITLANCGTQACFQWRERIRSELEAGQTDEQIIQSFVNDYGPRVVGEPPRQGFTSLVWLIPPVLLILAAVIYWQVMRRLVRQRAPAAGPSLAVVGQQSVPAEPQDEYAARLEQMVKENS